MDCIGVCSETATTQAELNPKSVEIAQTSTTSLAAEMKKKRFDRMNQFAESECGITLFDFGN